jgi:hypothetical protein
MLISNLFKTMQKVHPKIVVGLNLLHTVIKVKKTPFTLTLRKLFGEFWLDETLKKTFI